MITKLTSIEELKQIWVEILINKSNGQVTEVSDNSVLSAIGYGVGKVAQKAIKDIALVEANLFPDEGFEQTLDAIAQNIGIAPRFGASESSTFVRVVGDVGTIYQVGINQFISREGVIFNLENNVTIGSEGYAYAKVRSTTQGSNTNVPPLSINTVNPEPTGHRTTLNEYQALGGRDIEDDETFRRRIKEGANILAKGTISSITQAFNKINPNVLRVFYNGINSLGKPVLAIATQNGIDLSNTELDSLLEQGEKFFSLTELRPFGTQSYGVELKNVDYQPIDISFRVDLFNSVNPDDVRIDIQTRISKYLDFRFWKAGSQVEWDDLLEIVKRTRGVKYVPDQFFYPRVDVKIDKSKLPRLRGFLMLDLSGNIIVDNAGVLDPVFYPANPDFSFQASVLSSI